MSFPWILSKMTLSVDCSGSKNIGFTNVLRVSGKKAGILTLIGDIGKGVLAVWLAEAIGAPRPWVLAIGLSVILGHIFSVFLVFKGGKGVATALGSIFGIEPFLGVCVLGIWIGAVILFKFSSGGALAAFLGFPILAVALRGDTALMIFSFCILALIVFGHMENIARLAKGTEPKMSLFSI
jgi:glycerol-3-phosphate acyltransferase PlsY